MKNLRPSLMTALLLTVAAVHLHAGDRSDWSSEHVNSGGAYWRARLPVRIKNNTDADIQGGIVVLKLGTGADELPLVGQAADALRVCDENQAELLYRLTCVDGPTAGGLPPSLLKPYRCDAYEKLREMKAGGQINAPCELVFRVDCPARKETTCWVYYDNPDATAPYECLSVRPGIQNPGAEEGDALNPSGWIRILEDNAHHVSVTEETCVEGKRSFKTVVEDGAASTWIKWMQSDIMILPGREYVLSGWVKAKDLKGRAGWYIHVNGDRPMLVNQVQTVEEEDFDWRKVSVRFKAPPTATEANVGTVLYGTGTAWFDNVQLTTVDESVDSLSVSIGSKETFSLFDLPSSDAWYDSDTSDDKHWDWRAELKVRNFGTSSRAGEKQLVLAEVSPLLRRLRGRCNPDSLRVVNPTAKPSRGRGSGGCAVATINMAGGMAFKAGVPSMSEKTYFLYVSMDSTIDKGPELEYTDLVADAVNLARNPGFVDGTGQPAEWPCNEEPARRDPRLKGFRQETGGIDGGACVKLIIPEELADTWSGWRQEGVRIQPGARYLYAGYLKGNVATEARLHGHKRNKDGQLVADGPFFNTHPAIKGSQDWTLTSALTRMPSDARQVSLHLTMKSSGTLMHDEILFCRALEAVAGSLAPRSRNAVARRENADKRLEIWQENALVKVFRWDLPPADPVEELSGAAARNECEPLQMLVRSTAALCQVRVTASPLTGPGGARLDAPDVGWVGYVPIDYPTAYYRSTKPAWYRKRPKNKPRADGWADDWPDPLCPITPFDLRASTTQPIWLTVRVPAGAAEGTYRGQVKLSSPDMAGDVTVPIVFTVWGFDLPVHSPLKVIYDFRPTCDTRFGQKIDDEYYDKWYRFLADHRVSTDRIHPAISVRWKDGKAILDTEAHDRMARLCFDELGMNVTYTPHQFYAGGWANLPRSFLGLEPFSPDYLEAITACYRAYVAHMKKMGWYDRVIMYVSDEPHCRRNEQVTVDLARCCDVIRKADPGAKVYSSTWHLFEGLVGHVNVWGAGPHGSFTLDQMQERRDAGDIIWYTTDGHMCIDTPYLAIERLLPHLCWKYDVEAYEFWGVNWYTYNPFARGWHRYIYQRPSPDPDAAYWVRYPNGDGYLAYPGILIGLDEPVSSIRLEQAREGVEDYEYLRLLDSLIKQARAAGIDTADAEAAMQAAESVVHIPNAGGLRSAELMPDPGAVMDVRTGLALQIVALKKKLGQ